jgi:FMN-dependent NADH-azoreductase
MSKLFYIKASPQGERSYSSAAADAFVAGYKEANPGDEIATINLFDKDLPPFDGLTLQAKYTILHGFEYSQGSQAEAFDFQTKYLEFILGFIGFTDIRSLVIEPTLAAGPETAKEKREISIAKAKEMAKSF